ncbi:hypothetical protein EUGRSUZ_C01907 [Eucalyptus grandis]|uniref:Uncharacterized protein n=2 Tax=Eucalyptus grandis TaxID=71139 RepID=A0ACC3LES7_EUCGR|nr:hypothetical protein EUGRSUZ_C01907 [Eucalyptus grandis]
MTDAAIARLAQGTKMLKEGGRDKVSERTFEILPGEKRLKAYACYLSTSSGLVIGTLYLSTKRVVFHGDEPLCHYALRVARVPLLLDQLSFVSRSSKGLDNSEKYIQALKNINEALQHNRENNRLEGYMDD